MVFFKSANLPGARGRSNYYSSILLRDLCKAVANLNTPRNSRLTFHSPWSGAHQRRAAVRSTAALYELVSPVAKLREAFLIQKLFEDLWPGFQCQAHELYPVFVSSAISSIKTVRPGSPSVKNLTAFAFAYCRWDSRAQTSA